MSFPQEVFSRPVDVRAFKYGAPFAVGAASGITGGKLCDEVISFALETDPDLDGVSCIPDL